MRRVVLLFTVVGIMVILASGVASAVNRVGTNGDDTLNGTNANDTLLGKGGNDVIFTFAGNDIVGGGKGSDDLFGGSPSRPLGGSKIMYGGRARISCSAVGAPTRCRAVPVMTRSAVA